MKIKDIVTFVSKSITPQKGVTYNLYSLPSFDGGKTFEVLDGADIQSNNLRASRAQSQTQFELCRGAAVNADVSPNLQLLDRSSKGATTRLVA